MNSQFSTKSRNLFVSRIPFVTYFIFFSILICNIIIIPNISCWSLEFWMIILPSSYGYYVMFNDAKARWFYVNAICFDDNKFSIVLNSGEKKIEGNIYELFTIIKPVGGKYNEPFKLELIYRGEKYHLFEDGAYWSEERLWHIAKTIYVHDSKLIQLDTTTDYIEKYIRKDN